MLFLAWTASLPLDLSAQNRLAIQWDTPDNVSDFENELTSLSELNPYFIILENKLNEEKATRLDEADIPFLIKLDNEFITREEFNNDFDAFRNSILRTYTKYDSSPAFAGVIGFANSLVEHEQFSGFKFLYEIKRDSLHTISVQFGASLSGKFLNPSGVSSYALREFKHQITNNNLIVDYDWLMAAFEEYPEFKNSLATSSRVVPNTIALPVISEPLPLIHWSVLVLIALWISLAVNIKLNPTYLETIPRYFAAHRFFTDDILSYRERTSVSAIFLFFQHAFAGGLTVYILSKTFISDTGLEALYYHLPYLGVTGQNYFSLFVLSTLLVLLVEIIAMAWLYLPNTDLTHFNQILNLFTWIFHLDFILVTLMVTLYFAGGGSAAISVLSALYLLVWFIGFNISALSSSKRMGMARNTYLFKTIVLHTLTSTGLAFLLFYYDDWRVILELAVKV